MRIVATAALAVAIAGSLAITPALATTFVPAGYFPLEPDNTWTYLSDAFDTATVTVLPTHETVNGVPTWVLDSTGPSLIGGRVYLTNDENGLRLHGGVAVDLLGASLEFSPPLAVSPAVATFGQQTPSGGTASIDVAGFGTFPLAYAAQSTVVGTEFVSVPFGSFQSVRVEYAIQISGMVLGQPIQLNVSETDWYAPDIGPVRIQLATPFVNVNVNVNVPLNAHAGLRAQALPLNVTTWELVSFVPEPEHAMLAGLASVAALAAGRRRLVSVRTRPSASDRC